MIGPSSASQPRRTGNHSNSRTAGEFRRRSVSPDRHVTAARQAPPDKSFTPKKLDFQAGTYGRAYSACAVCLGRHPHKIIDCNSPTLWDKILPTLTHRINKVLSMRDGRAVCADWQRAVGCTSSRHDNRHICSGCASPSHGARDCPRAEKITSSHTL